MNPSYKHTIYLTTYYIQNKKCQTTNEANKTNLILTLKTRQIYNVFVILIFLSMTVPWYFDK